MTSVGSTQGFGPEIAGNFSSGGFSSIFPAPRYQSAVIEAFVKTISADFEGMFNRNGRGYPDVSTQGWNFDTVCAGETIVVGGTSASSPTFASIIALINDRLLASKKPTL